MADFSLGQAAEHYARDFGWAVFPIVPSSAPEDVVKYLLAGADVVMTASALLRHGAGHAAVLLDGLSGWMTRKGFTALPEMRGLLAVTTGVGEAAYERAGYVSALQEAGRTYAPWESSRTT